MNLTMDEFVEQVVQQIKDYLPPEYQQAEVWTEKVLKEGDQIYTAVAIKQPDADSRPRIYLEGFFKDYQRGVGMEEVLHQIAKQRVAIDPPRDLTESVKELSHDAERMKSLVTYRMVNSEVNQKILENRPHTDLGDAAFVYQVELNDQMRIPVDFKLQERMGVELSELHQLAVENTPRLLPVEVMTIGQALGMPMGSEMLVISNTEHADGAVAVNYPGVAEQIQDHFNGDFYLLPCSVHEMLAVSKEDGMSIDHLAKMIRHINRSAVSREDKLSDLVWERGAKGMQPVKDQVIRQQTTPSRAQEQSL